MKWARVEQVSLGASALMLFASAAIGFRWVASPYLRGYAAAGGAFFAVSRLAASVRRASAR